MTRPSAGTPASHTPLVGDADVITYDMPKSVTSPHRVPAGVERGLGDVVPDAVEIGESHIVDLLRAYPGASISLPKPVVPRLQRRHLQ